MKKCLIYLLKGLALSLILFNIASAKSPDMLFPTVDELSGGKEHWLQSVLPVEEAENGCKIYSATYAYFAKDVQPLFDIPRKNVYSVNIRFQECANTETAAVLYDKFSKVGDDDKKRLMSMGEKSLLYVQPNEKNPLMGNYYLTALYRNVVMQIHADDGFVVMDIGDLVSKRLSTYLNMDGALANGITLSVSKENHAMKNEFITFSGSDIGGIDINGTVYDSAGKRVEGAKVTVLETGDYAYTNKTGDFGFYLGDSEDGGEITVYRAITMADAYTAVNSGYYKVDISYNNEGRTGQDAWRLDIAPDGGLTGVSFNIADERQLPLSGKTGKDSITITRNCGSSVFGQCVQHFEAKADPHGLFRGTWTGSGGGGEWILYPGTFSKKSTNVSLAEADFTMEKGISANDAWIVSGAKEKMISISPKKKRHDDFYVSAVNLVLNVEAVLENKDKKKKLPAKAVYVYGVAPDNSAKALTFTPELPFGNKNLQGVADITGIYRNATYNKYKIGFLKSADELSVKLKPSIEMIFAVPGMKAKAPGAVNAWLESYAADDIAGSGKGIKPDKSPDILISLDIASYGSILKGIDVRATGETRRWNTDTAQFHPGVALVKDGKVLNKADGTVEYPLQQLTERLYLSMTRGSADMNRLKSFELVLQLDNEQVTVPVK